MFPTGIAQPFSPNTGSPTTVAQGPNVQDAPPAAPAPAVAAPSTEPSPVNNAGIAQALQSMATLLESQGDNPYRVAAYQRAGQTVARLATPLHELYRRGGVEKLDALPGIGPRIAGAIVEMLETGHWQRLERLRGSADPQALFQTIPGVGPDLARRLHEALGVDSLESLAGAVQDGRLEGVEGIGPRRAAAIRAALLPQSSEAPQRRPVAHRNTLPVQPPVELLLQVDREYRSAAEADRLPKIAPQRFNPQKLAWLPVLHTEEAGWHFTALYSNTERAHALDRTHDWVVIYAEDPAHRERAYTVVTAAGGSLVGQRVVRGRELECRRLQDTTSR